MVATITDNKGSSGIPKLSSNNSTSISDKSIRELLEFAKYAYRAPSRSQSLATTPSPKQNDKTSNNDQSRIAVTSGDENNETVRTDHEVNSPSSNESHISDQTNSINSSASVGVVEYYDMDDLHLYGNDYTVESGIPGDDMKESHNDDNDDDDDDIDDGDDFEEVDEEDSEDYYEDDVPIEEEIGKDFHKDEEGLIEEVGTDQKTPSPERAAILEKKFHEITSHMRKTIKDNLDDESFEDVLLNFNLPVSEFPEFHGAVKDAKKNSKVANMKELMLAEMDKVDMKFASLQKHLKKPSSQSSTIPVTTLKATGPKRAPEFKLKRHKNPNPFRLHRRLFQLLNIHIDDVSKIRRERKKLLMKLFEAMAALSDPFTQPIDTGKRNENILSIDLVSNLIIALLLPKYNSLFNGNASNFFMAQDLATIVLYITRLLKSDDEYDLMDIKVEDENWKEDLSRWNADETWVHTMNVAQDFHNLKLLYTVACVCMLTMYKLYGKENNLSLNPFLSFFLQCYKCQTLVILLGLEVDRRDEQSGFPGYPVIVRHTIKGASALRSIIAIILNGDFDKRVHDLKHESLNNFMHPFGRKAGSGALVVDMRIYAASMICFGLKVDDLTYLLYGLEPDDKFDEDIKYMFEIEYQESTENGFEDDYYMHHRSHGLITKCHRPVDENGEFEDDDEDYEEEEEYPLLELHPDCHCVFEDDDDDDDDEEEQEEEEENFNESKMVDASDTVSNHDEHDDVHGHQLVEIDREESGSEYEEERENTNDAFVDVTLKSLIGNSFPLSRSSVKEEAVEGDVDWRDIPRSFNVELFPNFVSLCADTLSKFDICVYDKQLLFKRTNMLSESELDYDTCSDILLTIAFMIHFEQECFSYKLLLVKDGKEIPKDLQPILEYNGVDEFYQFLSKPNFFENILKHNPHCGFALLDELFMAPGYRRVLIWFITHLKLTQGIVNYIYELIVGLRGNISFQERVKFPAGTRFPFSRSGVLKLSKVEKMMLLHEFFANSIVSLSIFSNEVGSENNNNITGENHEIDTANRYGISRSSCEKLAKVICLMIKSLVNKGELMLNDPEYKFEIQAVLLQWAGIIPEAHKLFFKTYEPYTDEMRSERLIRERNEEFKEKILEQQLKGTDKKKFAGKTANEIIGKMHSIKQGELHSSYMGHFGTREFNIIDNFKSVIGYLKEPKLRKKLTDILIDHYLMDDEFQDIYHVIQIEDHKIWSAKLQFESNHLDMEVDGRKSFNYLIIKFRTTAFVEVLMKLKRNHPYLLEEPKEILEKLEAPIKGKSIDYYALFLKYYMKLNFKPDEEFLEKILLCLLHIIIREDALTFDDSILNLFKPVINMMKSDELRENKTLLFYVLRIFEEINTNEMIIFATEMDRGYTERDNESGKRVKIQFRRKLSELWYNALYGKLSLYMYSSFFQLERLKKSISFADADEDESGKLAALKSIKTFDTSPNGKYGGFHSRDELRKLVSNAISPEQAREFYNDVNSNNDDKIEGEGDGDLEGDEEEDEEEEEEEEEKENKSEKSKKKKAKKKKKKSKSSGNGNGK